MMKALRRVIGLVVFVTIVAAVLFGVRQFIQSRGDQGPDAVSPILEEMTVERGELRVTVGATGAVTPERQVPLTFEVPGIVADVLVEPGQRVAAGDVLVRLDTADLEMSIRAAELVVDSQQAVYDALTAPVRDIDVAAAQAVVDAAQASLAAAYGTAPSNNQVEIARLQSEMARNQLWQAQLQRDLSANQTGLSFDVSGLIPDGADVPQDVIDQVNNALAGLVSVPSTGSSANFTAGLNQAEYGVDIADASYSATAGRGANAGSVAQAQAAVVSAQSALDRLLNGPSELDLQMAEIGLQQAQLALDQARSTLEQAVIYAPFDGVVAAVNAVSGELPPTQQPAVLLVDESKLYLDLAVDETDVVDMAVGQPADLRFDALPDARVTGVITRVADTPVLAGQLVSYPVRVAIDPSEAPVRLGMTSTATVVVQELDDVLVVPNRFIRLDRASQQAYVTIETDDGRFTEIPVQLGLRNQTESQVVSGLDEGQRIVIVARSTFDPFSGPPRAAAPR
ncbi:MAG: efflux RND transporter periplasmic adaptor subunit [Anaerolineae bacterium]